MHFRNAEIIDLPAIVAIYNSTIPGRTVTADLEPVTVASREAWFDRHAADKWPLLIVEDDEQIIGWLSFQAFYQRAAYNATAEISIYLHTSQRGKGYGRKVLQYAIDYAPKIGLTTLLGFIFAHNFPSIKLFTQAGFEEWGHLNNIANLDGTERSLKIFGKRVG